MKSNFDWAGWIKNERIARGWSQNEMALKSNIPHWQGRLSNIEAGKLSITFRTVVVAARLFGYSPEEAMEISDAPYKAPNKMEAITRREVGKIVQARRESLRMTIRELCERTGLHYSGILHTERTYPTKVKIDNVILLDSVLGFDGELIGLTWELVERELAEKQ